MCNGIERISQGRCHNDEFVSFTDMSQSGQNRSFAVAGECTCMCSMVGPPFVDEMIQ